MIFFIFFSQLSIAQPLTPQQWIAQVLDAQPIIAASESRISQQVQQLETVQYPLPHVQASVAPLSLSSDVGMGFQAQLSQSIPNDLSEQRRLIQHSADAARHSHRQQQLSVQRHALYDYVEWLELCQKWALSQAHENLLLKHLEAMTAQTLSNEGRLVVQFTMDAKHAQQQQESLRWSGSCQAAEVQLQRWFPDLKPQQYGPSAGWPNIGEAAENHPLIDGLVTTAKSADAQIELLDMQKRPNFEVMSQWNTMNHYAQHYWMLGAGVHWTRPAARKAAQQVARLQREEAESIQIDAERTQETIRVRAELQLSRLKQEKQWIEEETLPRLLTEKEALVALFDSAQTSLAAVIDVEHRLLQQEERKLEIMAEAWRNYADWCTASNVLITEVSQ